MERRKYNEREKVWISKEKCELRSKEEGKETKKVSFGMKRVNYADG